MNRYKEKNNQGFIAIISLLIIATVSTMIAMTILREGVDNASLSLFSIYYENARINANICIEDSLMRMRYEDQFSRDLNYTLAENEGCTTTIQWQAPQEISPGITETAVSLSATGTAHEFNRTIDYDLIVQKHDVNYSDGSINYTNIIKITSIAEITN